MANPLHVIMEAKALWSLTLPPTPRSDPQPAPGHPAGSSHLTHFSCLFFPTRYTLPTTPLDSDFALVPQIEITHPLSRVSGVESSTPASRNASDLPIRGSSMSLNVIDISTPMDFCSLLSSTLSASFTRSHGLESALGPEMSGEGSDSNSDADPWESNDLDDMDAGMDMYSGPDYVDATYAELAPVYGELVAWPDIEGAAEVEEEEAIRWIPPSYKRCKLRN